ncbi:MAG: hypothetical protein ILA06_04710 [Bacteroidaceae bacterium]|nr:hypothetical protein [Bacteroidaceae bacterium]
MDIEEYKSVGARKNFFVRVRARRGVEDGYEAIGGLKLDDGTKEEKALDKQSEQSGGVRELL